MTNNYFKMFTITRLRETQIKLLWDATSLQSERLPSRSLLTNFGEDMEKEKSLLIVGGDAN